MSEKEGKKYDELLAHIRTLEGVIFTAKIPGPSEGIFGGATMDCSCQNCACNARNGDICGCHPVCVCQGHTASVLDEVINVLLGAATRVPMSKFKSLLDVKEAMKKKTGE